MCACTHTHIYTYILTYIHTYLHHTYIHACIYTCMHAYIHTYIHIHTLYIHGYMHICILIYPRPIKFHPLKYINLYTMSYRYSSRLKTKFLPFSSSFSILLGKSAMVSRFALAQCIEEEGGSDMGQISMEDKIRWLK